MIAAAAVVIMLWHGKPPACPRLDPPITVYAASVEAAAEKAQVKAAKRGATHLYVRRAWAGPDRGKVEAVAYRCEDPK